MRIFGHRGHRHHSRPDLYTNAPFENSLPAFADALAACDGVETDVITTAEGACFLAHDTLFSDRVHYELAGKLDPASREKLGQRRMDELDNATAESLRLKDGTMLPSLAALCDCARKTPDKILNLELKGPHALEGFARFRNDNLTSLANPVILSSFNWPALGQARALFGHTYPLGVLFALPGQTKSPMFPGWPGAPDDAAYIPLDGETALHDPVLAKIAPDFFCLEHRAATPAMLDAISRLYPDSRIILWGAAEPHPDKDPVRVRNLMAMPRGLVYAVISDFPAAWRYHLTVNDYPLE